MKFMVTWSIPQDKWLPIIKKFTSLSPQEQKNAGEGATMIGRWHDAAGRRGVVLFEANSVAPVQRYIGLWNALCDCEITPVVDDEEATVVYRQIVADNNA
jgi:hypothetical protein